MLGARRVLRRSVYQGAGTVADNFTDLLYRARKVAHLEIDLFGSWDDADEENFVEVIEASEDFAHRVLAACGAMPALDSLFLRRWDYLDGFALGALGGHSALKNLHLQDCRGMVDLGDELWRLPNLRTVVVSDSDLQGISPAVSQAKRLRSLTINGENGVAACPDALFALPNLRSLWLNHPHVNFDNARNVTSLSLRTYANEHLPPGLGSLFLCLEELDLRDTSIAQLPDYLLHMVQLERLVVDEHLLPGLLPGFRAWEARGILVTA